MHDRTRPPEGSVSSFQENFDERTLHREIGYRSTCQDEGADGVHRP
jgi:hypothetical protein